MLLIQVLCERVKESPDAEEVIAGLKSNFPAGIPECGADALRFTLCSSSFKSECVDRGTDVIN